MIDLPDFLPLRISQTAGRATRKDVDALDQLLAIVPEARESVTVPEPPQAALPKRLLKTATSAGQNAATTRLENGRGTAITLARIKTGDAFSLMTQARKLLGEC